MVNFLRKLPCLDYEMNISSMATYATLSRALDAASHRSGSLEGPDLVAILAPPVPPFLEVILWHAGYGRGG